MPEGRDTCEDCGLEFDESELDYDGLCPDCRLDEEDEEELDADA